jgi:hypothetical protein
MTKTRDEVEFQGQLQLVCCGPSLPKNEQLGVGTVNQDITPLTDLPEDEGTELK